MKEKKLLKLLDKFRGKGEFDCIVPGSGEKIVVLLPIF